MGVLFQWEVLLNIMPTVSVSQIATVESDTTAAGADGKHGGSDNLTRDSRGIACTSWKMGGKGRITRITGSLMTVPRNQPHT